jgi:hypothetical protein
VNLGPGRREREVSGRLAQALAVACMAFIVGTIAHKGVADIAALAQRHAGAEFWPALARYFLGNIAGGSSAGAQGETRAP